MSICAHLILGIIVQERMTLLRQIIIKVCPSPPSHVVRPFGKILRYQLLPAALQDFLIETVYRTL